jgi:hypothetical protein
MFKWFCHAMLMLLLEAGYNTAVLAQDTIAVLPARKVTASTVIDCFTTFSAINVMNGENHSEQNSLHFYYNLTLNSRINSGQFQANAYYFNEFGIRNYLDSLTFISEDQYNVKISLSRFIKNSGIGVTLSLNAKSQFFNHYDYRTDSLGQVNRYLFTSFLSPGYANFSAGFRFEIKKIFTLELGLANGRKTIIRNQSLFESRNAVLLYGLPAGTRQKVEFGYILCIIVPPYEITPHIFLENFTQMSVNRFDVLYPVRYTIDLNTAIHFKFLRHFRISLRTKCLYDALINPEPRVSTSLGLGFYMNNTF